MGMIRVVHRYVEESFVDGKGKRFWVVGSFPSVLIREAMGKIDGRDVDFFYGAYQNRFWMVLLALLQKRGVRETLEYGWTNPRAVSQRKRILDMLGLGITDLYSVIETYGGASDVDIHPVMWNPHLRELFCMPVVLFATSKEVMRRLRSYASRVDEKTMWIEVIPLPSPSPLSRRAGYHDEVLLQFYERIFVEHGII